MAMHDDHRDRGIACDLLADRAQEPAEAAVSTVAGSPSWAQPVRFGGVCRCEFAVLRGYKGDQKRRARASGDH